MPTRRIMLLTVGVAALSRPVFGSIRLWGVKTMAATTPGTILHTVAEVATILT
jgi:hypothetical protein